MDPFSPFTDAHAKRRRIATRIDEVKLALAQAQIPPDHITVSALILVLADVARGNGVPLVNVISAFANLDGAKLTVQVTPEDEDEDEPEVKIGGSIN